MSKFLFSDHPYLSGNFKPMRFEGEARFLEIEGDLPEDLVGAYVLNTACPQFPPNGKNYHWFSGDGKVHGFYFKGNGVVDYCTKWVKTTNFEMERVAQKSLFGNKKYGSRAEMDPSVRHIRAQSANTNVLYHGGHLLALEDGNPPIALHPQSLETIGSFDYHGSLDGPMTAHPHVDSQTGELISFGRMVGGLGSSKMSHLVVSSSGELTENMIFDAPYCALLHDFAISERYVLYPLGPAILDPARIKKGQPILQWEGERPSFLGVLDRVTLSVRWIEMDSCFMWHTLNAFDDGDFVCLDLVRYRRLPRYDQLEDVRFAQNPEQFAGKLVRWRVDLSQSSPIVQEEILDDLISEFPRVDERVVGQKHRHAFFLCLNNKEGASRHWDALVHLDLETGKRCMYDPGKQSFMSEAVFVPRPGSVAEGDGFLLVPVYRSDLNCSELHLLCATDLDQGPIAKIRLPFRMNPSFHGNFHPDFPLAQ
ncbi:MAG: carotenoid oxygenase [Proteobacteria bacterium]|nr:carotenoid oxygenase [Pseudomonadota bacterium]